MLLHILGVVYSIIMVLALQDPPNLQQQQLKGYNWTRPLEKALKFDLENSTSNDTEVRRGRPPNPPSRPIIARPPYRPPPIVVHKRSSHSSHTSSGRVSGEEVIIIIGVLVLLFVASLCCRYCCKGGQQEENVVIVEGQPAYVAHPSSPNLDPSVYYNTGQSVNEQFVSYTTQPLLPEKQQAANVNHSSQRNTSVQVESSSGHHPSTRSNSRHSSSSVRHQQFMNRTSQNQIASTQRHSNDRSHSMFPHGRGRPSLLENPRRLLGYNTRRQTASVSSVASANEQRRKKTLPN